MWKVLLSGVVLATALWSSDAFAPEVMARRADTSLQMRQQGEPERQRRALLAAAMAAMLAPVAAIAEDEGPTTLHIVNYPKEGSCGQADVPPAGVFFAKNLGGMTDGPCSKDGYSVPEGTAPGIKEKDKQRTYEIYGK